MAPSRRVRSSWSSDTRFMAALLLCILARVAAALSLASLSAVLSFSALASSWACKSDSDSCRELDSDSAAWKLARDLSNICCSYRACSRLLSTRDVLNSLASSSSWSARRRLLDASMMSDLRPTSAAFSWLDVSTDAAIRRSPSVFRACASDLRCAASAAACFALISACNAAVAAARSLLFCTSTLRS